MHASPHSQTILKILKDLLFDAKLFTSDFIRYIPLNTLIPGIAAIVIILGSILAIAWHIKKSEGG